jgi:hypothetical protein
MKWQLPVGLVLTFSSIQAFAQVKPEVISRRDGASEPGAISDLIAYRHFFELLGSKPDTKISDDMRRRSYLNHYFRPGCGDLRNDDRSLSDVQIDRLLTHADRLAAQLREINPGPTNDLAESATRKRRTEEALTNAMSLLSVVVDSDAAEKIRRHVFDHVKRHISIVTVRVPLHTHSR